MEKILEIATFRVRLRILLCLLLLHVAFGAEKECDKEVYWTWDLCDDETCIDLCLDSFEDFRDVQVITSTCVAGTHTCQCHILSEAICDVESSAPLPAPSMGADVDFN
ncbi:uncharacterized protein LOC130787541 [Actinidia eriantha]|uniref:uncharacterized protein LOC130787541 n=1 Tax=Actinidia eriantha TaxID=165200 RepID=UPI00258FBCF9|nr:uncharacterized protein LOC130787541 [Actinidia eriantha]